MLKTLTMLTTTAFFACYTIALVMVGLSATPAQAGVFGKETKLTAADAGPNDNFGRSVAISGNTAIVGAWKYDDGGSNTGLPFIFNSGSAYLFDVTTGNQLAKLTATDAAENDRFGVSVAISGDTALVGAFRSDDGGSNSGSAYLFDVTTGNQLSKLTASDAEDNDLLGTSVAISGNTAIVGAYGDDHGGRSSGSAYLFDVTTGNQLAKLTASDAAEGDVFGRSVAISGNTALVGASGDDHGGRNSGSAYLFDVTTGNQLAKLTVSDAEEGDNFGWSVAISGDTALVGAPFEDDRGINSGSAYLFDITTGNQLAKLTALDSEAGDAFGASVAISGNMALVGAYRLLFSRSGLGSAYLFNITTGDQLAELTASDVTANDEFGRSVAISGDTALVGAWLEDERGIDSGSVYLFENIIPEPSSLLLATLAGLFGLRSDRR